MTPWLKGVSGAPQNRNVLLGLPDRPLAPQLAERWRGRRFRKLSLCTGSTDTDGAFLSWAHETFGIKEATICLSPAFASFDPARLSKLPFDIRIIKAEPEQLMHAKFYWLSGPDGDAAIVGSANCSAAAWLARGGYGNVELVVPYDHPRAEDFRPVLKLFDAPKLTPAQALLAKRQDGAETEGPTPPAYRLLSLRLRAAGRVIEAVLDPAVAANDEVKLILSGSSGTASVALSMQADRLTGRLPPDFEIGSMTPFARAEITSEGVHYTTKPRWLDNEVALERASREEAVDPNLRDLSRRSLFSTDHQKILEAVYAVSAQLLNAADAEPPHIAASGEAHSPGGASKQKEVAEDTTRAVDPAAIVRSLKDLRIERQVKNKDHISVYGGTLDGVIAQLFSRDDEKEIDLSEETWSGEIDKDPEPAKGAETGKKEPARQAAPSETIIKFNEQLDYFLSELGRLQFAQTCDAKRMVQALAFPLLLCVRGAEAGWLPSRVLASSAARVVEIMFERVYGRGTPQGLFRQVQARYVASGKQEAFLQAVGEGTLWSALIASLATMEATSLGHVIRYASAISSVFACKELLATTDAEQLSALMSGLIIKTAEYALIDRAPKIAKAMISLETLLRSLWEILFQEQGRGRDSQPAGSVLWSPHWGWKILAGSPAQVYCAGYINVEDAARKHQDIETAIHTMLDAVAIAPKPSGSEGELTSIEVSRAINVVIQP